MSEGRKRKILTIVSAFMAILLAAGAGAGLRWWQGRQNAPDTAETTALSSQRKALRGDVDGAQADIDAALKDENLSDHQKHELYLQKGVNYFAQKNYDKALENYKLAEQYEKTDNLYQSMAQISIAQKDKEQAIKYYEEALKYIDTTNAGAEQTREIIQNNIDLLKGKPLPGPPESLAP